MQKCTHANTSQVSKLCVSVDIHFDDTVSNGGLDLIFGRARSAVEDKVQRLRRVSSEFLTSVCLVLAQKLGLEANITRLVNTVHVSECSGDGEVRRDLAQSVMNIKDIGWLGVQAGVVDTCVINTIFLTTGDTDLHLEPEAKGSHALEVLYASRNVLLLRLFREIEHVGGEEGFAVLLEISLVGIEHTIEPGEEFVSAMITMHHDGPRQNLRIRWDMITVE